MHEHLCRAVTNQGLWIREWIIPDAVHTGLCTHKFQIEKQECGWYNYLRRKVFRFGYTPAWQVCGCKWEQSERERDIQIINKWIDETCFWKELFLIMAKLKDRYIYIPKNRTKTEPMVPFANEYYVLIDIQPKRCSYFVLCVCVRESEERRSKALLSCLL